MREVRFWMKVWDAPVRLFHWLSVVLLVTLYVTMRTHHMDWHMRAGYTLMALVLFRLIWGFVGSDTARFSRFLRSPLAGFRHLSGFLRHEPDNEIGHNAAGGWMVLLLLGLMAAQITFGLGAHTRTLAGPLAGWIGPDWSDVANRAHGFTFYLLLAAIVLHVLVVLAYAAIKRQDLVRPMITGRKRLPGNFRAPRLASPALAGAVMLLSATIAWIVATRLPR